MRRNNFADTINNCQDTEQLRGSKYKEEKINHEQRKKIY